MKKKGITTWFKVSSSIHTSDSVVMLCELLKLDADTAVGKLCRLWSWAKKERTEDGMLGRMPPDEIAAVMRWRGKPEKLVDALLAAGLLERTEGGELAIHGWYEWNGCSLETARKDSERKCKIL